MPPAGGRIANTITLPRQRCPSAYNDRRSLGGRQRKKRIQNHCFDHFLQAAAFFSIQVPAGGS
jgi:hypothetical protein